MSQAQTVAAHHLNPVFERLISTAMLFRRRAMDDTAPLGMESALPGLDVSESTWAEWEAAMAESLS